MNVNASRVSRLVLVMLLWAACFPLITLGQKFAPHLAFAAMRGALAGSCLLVLGYVLRRPVPRGRKTWAHICLAGFGVTTLGFLGMFHAAEYIAPGLATVIFNIQPLLAAVLAHVALGEKLDGKAKAGLVAGFLGIVTVASPSLGGASSNNFMLGLVFVVLAAVGVSVGNIAIKALASRTDAIMATGFQLLIGATFLAGMSLGTEDASAIVWTPGFMAVLGILSILGTALVLWLWFSVLEEMDVSHANAFTFLVPVFGLFIGTFYFGESFGWVEGIGVTLVLVGIALAQISTSTAGT
ncbi:MAG: DMT family transporter [Alphaproteobacteria bacterium]